MFGVTKMNTTIRGGGHPLLSTERMLLALSFHQLELFKAAFSASVFFTNQAIVRQLLVALCAESSTRRWICLVVPTVVFCYDSFQS